MEIIEKLYSQKSNTEKILYILYENHNINREEITKLLLLPSPLSSPSSISSLEKNTKEHKEHKEHKEQGNSYEKTYDVVKIYLQRLLNSNRIVRDESSKPYTYDLSYDERKLIDKEIEDYTAKWIKIEEDKRLAIEQEDYLNSSLIFWSNYIDNHFNASQRDLVIDLKTLKQEAMLYNHQILNYFFEKTEEQLEFVRIAFNRSYDYVPLIIIKGKDTTTSTLKEVRSEKNLISIQCQIDFKSDIQKSKQSVKYECPSCGNVFTIINYDFLRDKLMMPKSCGCGRKGGFKQLKYETIVYQKLLLSDLDVNLFPGEQPVQKNAIISGALIKPEHERILNIGDKVQVIGLLKEYTDENNDSQIKTYFDILGIEFLNKIDYDGKFSAEELESFKKLSSDPKNLYRFAESIFVRHNGDYLAKVLCTTQLFSGFVNKGQRQSLHLLLFGEPGTGKTSNFLDKINTFHYRAKKISQNNNTSAGLSIGSVKNDFLGKNIAELGSIPQANKGYFLIDEINDINKELFGTTIEAMEGCTITSNKTGARGTYPADIKVLATMNPTTNNNKFIDGLSLFEQPFGLNGKFIDRFDFVIPFVDKKSFEEKFSTIKEVQERLPEFSDFFIRKYLIYAEQFNPVIPDSLEDKFKYIFLNLATRDSKNGPQSDYRIIRKARNLVTSIARFCHSDLVSAKHILLAGDIYLSYLDTLEEFSNCSSLSKVVSEERIVEVYTNE